MRALVIVAAALVLLAAAVVVFAPATLVVPYVARSAQRIVVLTAVEGTLWQGRATLAAGSDRIPLRWTLRPWPLLSGTAEIALAPGDAAARNPRADLRASRDRIVASAVDVALPAGILPLAVAQLTPVKMQWQADGLLTARTPQLAWQPGAWEGGVDLDWRNARLMLTGMAPVNLGDLSARMTANGDRLAGSVDNRDGDLGISGSVSVGSRGGMAVSLLLTPRRGDDAELARVLGAIGTPEGSGWRVTWPAK